MRLPELLIIGAQKCGTSTLYASLSRHHQIWPATDPRSGDEIKEIGFFCNHWHRGADWYRAHFQCQDGVAMEATPNYLNAPDAQKRIAELIPGAKLIVSLRDPVYRAYSQFNHYCQTIETSKDWDWRLPGRSFAVNLDAELRDPISPWYGILGRGNYVEQLEHLMTLFPRTQIHVMIMERWAADPACAFAEAIRFAGLEPASLTPQMDHVRPYTVDPIADDEISQLTAYYHPLNQRLFDLLGESIEEWC